MNVLIFIYTNSPLRLLKKRWPWQPCNWISDYSIAQRFCFTSPYRLSSATHEVSYYIVNLGTLLCERSERADKSALLLRIYTQWAGIRVMQQWFFRTGGRLLSAVIGHVCFFVCFLISAKTEPLLQMEINYFSNLGNGSAASITCTHLHTNHYIDFSWKIHWKPFNTI